jgi:hypothetical protein
MFFWKGEKINGSSESMLLALSKLKSREEAWELLRLYQNINPEYAEKTFKRLCLHFGPMKAQQLLDWFDFPKPGIVRFEVERAIKQRKKPCLPKKNF